jgi:hypothetical protein
MGLREGASALGLPVLGMHRIRHGQEQQQQ